MAVTTSIITWPASVLIPAGNGGELGGCSRRRLVFIFVPAADAGATAVVSVAAPALPLPRQDSLAALLAVETQSGSAAPGT